MVKLLVKILHIACSSLLPLLILAHLSPVLATLPSLTLRITAPNGYQLPRANQIYLSTLDFRPVALYGSYDPQKTFSDLPNEPLMLSSYVEVPGFGNLDFTAALGGAGFLPNGQTVDVLYEVARHRILLIETLFQMEAELQISYPQSFIDRFNEAKQRFDIAHDAPVGTADQATKALASLIFSAPLGEDMIVEKGKQLLEKHKLASDQTISVFSAYESREGLQFGTAAKYLFQMGVGWLQWQSILQPDGTYVWPTPSSTGVTPTFSSFRMTPGAWFNNLPSAFAKNRSAIPAITTNISEFMRQAVTRYNSVSYWQIVSEPHSWSDQGFIEPEDIVEIARSIHTAIKTARSSAKTGVNTVLPWGEDAAFNLSRTPAVVSPFTFYTMLDQAGINYDFIVLQLYPAGRDMLEHDQMLTRFATLGKPIHIELQASSSNDAMPGSTRTEWCDATGDCRHPSQKYFTWHRPWDQPLQAQWLEDMFYVLMSNSSVKEFNWWDLADYYDVYVPWGGLTDSLYMPKQSFYTLKRLKESFDTSHIAGDINLDGKTGIFDYGQLIGEFGKTQAQGFSPADITNSTKVNSQDLLSLLGYISY